MSTVNDELTVGQKAVKLIRAGRCDDELMELLDALSARQKYLRSKEAIENLMAIEPGDTVRIKPYVRPKYLAGVTCVVEEIADRKRNGIPMILCRLPGGTNWGKFRSGRVLMSPGSVDFIKKGENHGS